MNEQISNKELANNLKLLSDHFLLAEDGESVLLRLAAERLAAMPDTCMKREVTQYKWSCGCVSCVCDTDIQCLGCGATSCRGGNCQRKNVSVEAMPDAGEQEPYCHIGKNAQRGLDEKGVAKVWKEPLNNNGDIALYTQPQQPAPDHTTTTIDKKKLLRSLDIGRCLDDKYNEGWNAALATIITAINNGCYDIPAPDKGIDADMENAVDTAVNAEIAKERKAKMQDKETIKRYINHFLNFAGYHMSEYHFEKWWQRQSAEGGE